MKNMSPRTLLLLCGSWILVAIAIISTLRAAGKTASDVQSAAMRSDTELWSITHELSDRAIAQIVDTNTLWDDLASFARGELPMQWASDNLALSGAGNTSALWILGPDGDVRYSVRFVGSSTTVAPLLPLNAAGLKRLFTNPDEDYGAVHEFYWLSDFGSMSIFGAPITTSDDPGRKKPADGFYFVAYEISENGILKDVGGLGITGNPLPTATIPPEMPPTTTSPHVFWHRMSDADGATIGALRLERLTPEFVSQLRQIASSRAQTIGLWLLIGLATTALIVALNRTQQWATTKADEMTRILREANERLEDRVAERTADLEVDIAKRESVEETLLKRTDELERMNKVMMDREQRIAELKKGGSGSEPTSHS